jgi:hypothetical protein
MKSFVGRWSMFHGKSAFSEGPLELKALEDTMSVAD